MDYCKGDPSRKRGVITGMYRVIIVDDEFYIRKRVCRCIDWVSHGFRVEAEIESGEKAAFYIQQNQVDLAVVDISMPDISGLELIERIRKENTDLKIIILTGYDYFEYAKKAVNLGVSHFMLKPVDKQEMSETVIKIREELDAAERVKMAIQELRTDKERLESAGLSRMLLENGGPEIQNFFKDLAGKTETPQYVSADQIVKKVKDIVKKQYSNGELCVQRIADILCLNANYVGITFKRAAGTSISQYINQVRMENAAYLIVHTLIPIQEIAETVGYSDQFYFSKKFKQIYGMSPSTYRYSNSNV